MAETVVVEVLWTDKAKQTFSQIVEYLHREWTEKEVKKFINRTHEMLSTFQRYPEMCRPSQKRKNVRIGILNKLIYWKNFQLLAPKSPPIYQSCP